MRTRRRSDGRTFISSPRPPRHRCARLPEPHRNKSTVRHQWGSHHPLQSQIAYCIRVPALHSRRRCWQHKVLSLLSPPGGQKKKDRPFFSRTFDVHKCAQQLIINPAVASNQAAVQPADAETQAKDKPMRASAPPTERRASCTRGTFPKTS